MHCSKCGAVVYGRYCSCCGQRVRTDLEEFRLAETRAMRRFIKEHSDGTETLTRARIAEACWLASHIKYGLFSHTLHVGDQVSISVYKELDLINEHAETLFNRVIDF